MATPSKLSIINAALSHLKERRVTEDEPVEAWREMDAWWNGGDIRDEWLNAGYWNFATRTSKIERNTALTPPFGYSYTFDKPSDWIRTARVASDEYFNSPLTRYDDESSYWFADVDPLYVSYVSNDASYGYDFAAWPELFTRFCEFDLAKKAMNRVGNLDRAEKADLVAMHRRALVDARNKDAMNEPAKFPPFGSWVRSRSQGGSRDPGGSSGSWY